MARALDAAARPAASAMLEDENLTRLILGEIDEGWEWTTSFWAVNTTRGARTLLRATATCKRWHKMDLNSVWKQLVLARWPAAAKLNVQNFKMFYRSHDTSLKSNQGGTVPDIDATVSQDPADIQFIVDMGLRSGHGWDILPGREARRSILSVVLDGSAARSLDVPAAPGLGQLYSYDPADHAEEGLGWTVHPNVYEMGASLQGSPRNAFRDAFSTHGTYLTLHSISQIRPDHVGAHR